MRLVPAAFVVGLELVEVDRSARPARARRRRRRGVEAVAARERRYAAVKGFEAYAALIGTASHVLNRAGGRYLSN